MAWTTWNPGDIHNYIGGGNTLGLSNGNLTVGYATGPTGAGTSASSGLRAIDGKLTGKYHIEWNQSGHLPTPSDSISCVGIAQASAILNQGATAVTLSGDGTGGVALFGFSGNVWSGGSKIASTVATWDTAGKVAVLEIDIGAKLLWFANAAGNWNANGSANPATGAGGLSFAGLSGLLYPFLIYSTGGTGVYDTVANFGQTSFARAVSSGFIAGWPGGGGSSMRCMVI